MSGWDVTATGPEIKPSNIASFGLDGGAGGASLPVDMCDGKYANGIAFNAHTPHGDILEELRLVESGRGKNQGSAQIEVQRAARGFKPFPLTNIIVKQRPKRFKAPKPSRFCHVCGRRAQKASVATCGRISEGLCRKVVCSHCIARYGWDASGLNQDGMNSSWLCPHCEGKCGGSGGGILAKAQCNTYTKTNFRRKLGTLKRREASRSAGCEA